MASLSVYGGDFSIARKKAYDDAHKMQAAVNEECAKDGKEAPAYLLQELIGKGSFGRVYKAKDLKTAEAVAVKIIDIEESDTLNPKLADTYSEFLKEISALKLLRDGGAKNVNYILDAMPVGQAMWLIVDYCAGGSVATLMKPTAPGGLQEKWIIPILREVSEAIYWVHRQGIIHRDIKCANVLVTEAGGVQLCDFGIAGIVETKFDKRSTFIGTPHWMAPELFDQSTSYGTEVDIWAFGAMVFEIASGLPPNAVAGVTLNQLGTHLKQHTPRLAGDNYSPQLKDLVAFCLVDDPARRPVVEQVQRHPYIFGTAAAYPTDTLAMLVKGYKLWESQGGSRKSLFAPGGAQGPSLAIDNLASTAMATDEWNFSTTLDFDRSVFDNPDSLVFDVYGAQVDYETGAGPVLGGMRGDTRGDMRGDMSANGNVSGNSSREGSFGGGGAFPDDATPRPSRMKGRRRQPPPQLPTVRAPLEKVFDPNTITNYEDNSRAYYGLPPPPLTATASAANTATASDLPLRDDSLHSTLRESLIDLDASQVDFGESSQFAAMDTIRAANLAGPRISVDYDFSSDDAAEYNRPVLSNPADLPRNRRTQEWKFPTMATQTTASTDMPGFPFPEEGGGLQQKPQRNALVTPPGSRSTNNSANNSNNNSFSMSQPPVVIHQHTDPVGLPSQGYDLMVPGGGGGRGNANRMSVSSLIDLDASLPDPTPDLQRPSTANSDAMSYTGSDLGGSAANPFDLEWHTSMYQPTTSTQREPSIYVSDDSEYAHMVAATIPGAQPQQQQQLQQNGANGTGLGLPGLAPGFGPPNFSVNGVRASLSIGDEPDGELFQGNGNGRRAIESYLDTAGVYTGDTYLDSRGFPDELQGGAGMFGQQRFTRGANGAVVAASGSAVGMAYSTDDNVAASVSMTTMTTVVGSRNSSSTASTINIDNDNLVRADEAPGHLLSVDDAVSLPPLPSPPSPHVMQGLGSREEVRDEMARLLDSFQQHLSFTNTYVTSLPVRPAGNVGGMRLEAQVND